MASRAADVTVGDRIEIVQCEKLPSGLHSPMGEVTLGLSKYFSCPPAEQPCHGMGGDIKYTSPML